MTISKRNSRSILRIFLAVAIVAFRSAKEAWVFGASRYVRGANGDFGCASLNRKRFLLRIGQWRLTRFALIAILFCYLVGITTEHASSQQESKETAPEASRPKLSEATAITDRSRGISANTPLPKMDAAKEAQEKRARELARLRGEITFDDLKFDIEKDGLFKETMLTEEIKKLHEKKVKIRGFMLPSSVFQTKGIKQFVLVRDNKECCFGPGAAIYDSIMVEMAADKTTDYNERVMTVSGVLSIDTESYQYPDGGHYAIYKIVASEAK